jgi:MFS family permease
VVLAISVWSLRRPFAPTLVDGSVSERIVAGWRALRTSPGCIHAVALLVVFNVTVVPFMGLIPIYAAREYGGGAGLAGLFSSAQGLGAIAGGVAVTVLAMRFRRAHLLGRIVLVVSAALGFYAAAPNPAAVTIGAAVLGGACSAMFITASAIVQRDAPPSERGRVMSLMQACTGTSYGVGILAIGFVGDLVNLHVAFAVGAVGLLAGCWALRQRSSSWRSAIDGEEHLHLAPALAA